MASYDPDQAAAEAALRTRIADLEARLANQAAELEATYALLGRERAERLRVEAALGQEQRISAALFAYAPLGIQIYDRQGYSLRLNEAQQTMLGLADRSPGQGIANALTDPLHVITGKDEAFRRAYAGEVVHLTGQTMALDAGVAGRETTSRAVHYHQALFPVYDEQGLVEAVLTFCEDVSEAHATRQALSTATQLVEAFFEYAPLALEIFDREGFAFRMNEAHRRLLGAPSCAYGIGEFNALTDPFMVAQGQSALYARAYAGEVVRVPTKLIDFDDPSNAWETASRTVRFEQLLFPIVDEDGSVSAVVSCVLEAAVGPTP